MKAVLMVLATLAFVVVRSSAAVQPTSVDVLRDASPGAVSGHNEARRKLDAHIADLLKEYAAVVSNSIIKEAEQIFNGSYLAKDIAEQHCEEMKKRSREHAEWFTMVERVCGVVLLVTLAYFTYTILHIVPTNGPAVQSR
jgi:hypothetical protein